MRWFITVDGVTKGWTSFEYAIMDLFARGFGKDATIEQVSAKTLLEREAAK